MFYIFNLKLLKYFSIWLFIWYLLYKLNIVKYQPSFNYLLAMTYILTKAIIYIIAKPVSLQKFIKIMIISIMLDIVPLMSLFPLKFNKTTFNYNLSYLLVYVLYMNITNKSIYSTYINDITYKNHKKIFI